MQRVLFPLMDCLTLLAMIKPAKISMSSR